MWRNNNSIRNRKRASNGQYFHIHVLKLVIWNIGLLRVKVAIHFFSFLALPNAISPSVFIPKSMRNEFRALKCLMFYFINHSSTHIENKFNLWLPKPYKLCIQALATNATQSMWCRSSGITIYCMNILKMHKKNYRRHWWRWKRLQKLLLLHLKNGYNQIEFATYTSSDFSHFANLYIFPFSLAVPIISILSWLPIENFLTPMYTLCFSNFFLFFSNHSTWERH